MKPKECVHPGILVFTSSTGVMVFTSSMRLLRYIELMFGAALCCSVLSGCVYEDIEPCPGDYYGRIMIENHWNKAPDASPEGMAYFFFPEGGGEAWRFDLPGKSGGEIKIPTGRYRFIIINDDTYNVTFDNENSFNEMKVSTLPGSLATGDAGDGVDISKIPQLSGMENQKVRLCPDMLWCYSAECAEVGLERDYTVIPTYPRRIVSNYHFRITDVVNLKGVMRMSAAISGMASSVTLHNLARSSEAVIYQLKANKQGEDAISGDFLSYGLATTPGMNNYLVLFVWLTDGKRYIYKFDVTSQTVNAPDPMDVWLRIEGLTLPESSSASGGGFDVSVDGWTTIDINL